MCLEACTKAFEKANYTTTASDLKPEVKIDINTSETTLNRM